MSNHNPVKAILLHHRQVKAGCERKADRAERRHYVFEINREVIKVRIEGDRQYLAACVLIFLMGLMLILAGLFYVLGAFLYG